MLRWRISAEGRNGAIAYDKYSVQHQILFSLMHGLYMEATDFWVWLEKIANKNMVYLYSVDMEHGLGSIAFFKYSHQIGFTL